MSVVAPPDPPPAAELELLIREARARQRRRKLLLGGAVAVVAGVGLSVWAAVPYGGSVAQSGHGPSGGAGGHVSTGSALSRREIGDVGSSGGVTWAVNGHGIWLTANGGRTWRQLTLPQGTGRVYSSQQGTGVQFLDRRNGWMFVNEIVGSPPTVGVRGVIARTTNGGRTWRESFVPSPSFGRISFLDARRGWLLTSTSRGEKLLRTIDGGNAWKPVSRPAVGGPMTFIDGRVGFLAVPMQIIGPVIGTPGANLYRTTDGGRTWSQSSFPWTKKQAIVQPLVAFGHRLVAAVLAPNHFQGWPVAIYASADGGRTWTKHAFPQVAYVGPSSFSVASPSTWFVAGHRTLFVTNDAGAIWRRIVLRRLPWQSRISKIVFTSRLDGWALFGQGFGGHSSLFRTTDGGRHWTPAGPRKPKPHRR